ncbi:MAG: metallophosphoesterase family protein [Myxococcales bacterium]|nr:MAG: metallophosphoesterase family protein [Myxococcales bacterium]
MKLGIFSDVHANIEALSAVMGAYATEKIDRYFCLGDIVGYGASPNECCNIVREMAEVTIVGNHDAAVAGRMDYSYYYDAARHALDKHADQLSDINMEWLKSLPYKHELDAYGVHLCHGSPLRLEEFDYIFAPEQAAECLAIWDELGDITLIGHSHLCKVFALKPGEVRELPAEGFSLEEGYKYIVSVGSVGQPRDHDNRAAYTVYDTEEKHFSFKRVEYDIEAAAEKVFAGDLEHNFGHRLFIGV